MADKIIVDWQSNIDALIAKEQQQVQILKETDKEYQKVNATAIKGQEQLEALLKRQQDNYKKLQDQLKDTAPGKEQEKLKDRISELGRSMEVTKVKIKEASTETTKLNANLKETGEAGDSLNGIFKKAGTAIVAALAVERVISFAKETVKLALEAEGVQIAFDKLNNPQLLEQLREATRGTVNDLELMKAAVRAQNFQIPLETLGGLFEFATQRASDTGQSVQFLVDSIVDGIGRKSPLILDNLGISAAALQEEMKKTGDFAQAAANIINGELSKSGEVVETNAQKVARLSAQWDNFKLNLGNFLISVGEGIVDFFSEIGSSISSILSFDWLDGIINPLKETKVEAELTADELERVTAALKDFNLNAPQTAADAEAIGQGLQFTAEQAKGTAKAFEEAGFIILENTNNANKAINQQIITLKSLKDELKGYQDALEITEIGSAEYVKLQEQIASTQEKINVALGKTKKALSEFTTIQPPDILNADGLLLDLTTVETKLKDVDEVTKRLREVALERLKAEEEERRIELLNSARTEEQVARETLEFKRENLLVELDLFRDNADEQRRIRLELAELDRELTKQEINNTNARIEARIRLLSATSNVIGSLAELFSRNAEFQKGLALFQVGVDTARAISGVTAAALSKGAVGLPEYLSILGIILNSIAQARTAINSSSIPQFAEGVIGFNGKGTETSDSNLVAISKGESIIKAKQTKRHKGLLTAINENNETSLRDIIMSEYLPKDFADNIAQSYVFNFKTAKLEEIMKDNTRASKKNTEFLAKVIGKQSTESRKYNYISRKQSKL